METTYARKLSCQNRRRRHTVPDNPQQAGVEVFEFLEEHVAAEAVDFGSLHTKPTAIHV